ncbi:MAG: hypothetical protein KF807_00125 [Xanthobacteraceae bacterium]|nr:hypothetical protein [Xanthobacteraceae bacterium]
MKRPDPRPLKKKADPTPEKSAPKGQSIRADRFTWDEDDLKPVVAETASKKKPHS